MSSATVALVRCETYEHASVESAVEKGIALLGGLKTFFKPGEHIVLKPNLLSATAPQLCVTTHPAVFAAVAQSLKAFGLRLSYGDSPAIGTCISHASAAGIEKVANELGIELADFDTGRKVQHKTAKANATFPIAHGVLAADGVVSIPKLKTHNLTRMTGAVKNQYGCVPGITKAQYHARFLLPQDFAEFVVDITSFVHPRLYIMDAVMAMEGNGPNTGDPKQMGVLLFSTDPVALDTIACSLIDLDPQFVPTCTAGERAGLGTCTPEDITCVGDTIDSFVDPSFNVVRKQTLGVTGSGVRRMIKDMVAPRPVISKRRCTRCGRCVDICPVAPKAVDWRDNAHKYPPVHNYAKCIRCYCCQEACPSRAITVRTPPLGTFMPVLAGLVLKTKTSMNAVSRTKKMARLRRNQK